MELLRHLSEFRFSSLFSTRSLTSPECLAATVKNLDCFREELEGSLYYAMKDESCDPSKINSHLT